MCDKKGVALEIKRCKCLIRVEQDKNKKVPGRAQEKGHNNLNGALSSNLRMVIWPSVVW